MKEQDLLLALKALADPKRFRMVREIAEAGEMSCGEVGKRFPLSQPTMSHHIKILNNSGILITRKEGPHSFISVNQALIRRIADLLPGILSLEAPAAGRGTRRRTKTA